MDMMTTVKARPDLLSLSRSAARGLASGAAASWMMSRFQDHAQGIFVGSGQASGDPATVQAADRAVMAITGHHLEKQDKQSAGEVVHYVVGTLTGGFYGVLSDVQPAASRWRGAAMGVVAATLIDQLAVPLAGLARPPWKYSLGTHLYGYASHLIFGLATEAVRSLITPQDAGGADDRLTLEDWALPLMLGLANGQRTMTPAAVVSIAAASSAIDLNGSGVSFLSSPLTAAALGVAALGEYYVDVQSGTPARIAPIGVAARAAGGALSGAAVARGNRRMLGALAGTAGALAGAYISYRVRVKLARLYGADRPVGMAEDMISLIGTAALTGFAALRSRAPAAA